MEYKMLREFKFLVALWKTNLAGALEYRAAFITQSIGMILNDAVYFVVWIIFFDRFPSILGWQLTDMFLVFGISASAFGLAGLLFGNAFNLGDIIMNALRVLGTGFEVACEVSVMAADAGLVRTDEDVIAVAGSHRGADTAILVRPVNSINFFDLRVKEILCKSHFDVVPQSQPAAEHAGHEEHHHH